MTNDVHHLAAAYALDALDADERAMFETHLEGCEACRADVADFAGVAGELATATAATPPSGLRDAVLSDIAQTRQERPAVRQLDQARRQPVRRREVAQRLRKPQRREALPAAPLQ